MNMKVQFEDVDLLKNGIQVLASYEMCSVPRLGEHVTLLFEDKPSYFGIVKSIYWHPSENSVILVMKQTRKSPYRRLQ